MLLVLVLLLLMHWTLIFCIMETKQFNDLFLKMYIFIIKVVGFFSLLLTVHLPVLSFNFFSDKCAMCMRFTLFGLDFLVCTLFFFHLSYYILTICESQLVSHYLKFYAKLLRKYHCYCVQSTIPYMLE